MNPKEQCKAIMLRSRKNYEGPKKKQSTDEEVEDQDQQALGQEEQKCSENKATGGLENKEPTPLAVNFFHHIKIPFPQRLHKNNLDK